MQDTSTGELKEIPQDLINKVGLTEACNTIILPQNQGPTFFIGEELLVKGGLFKVHAITQGRLYLDSLAARSR